MEDVYGEVLEKNIREGLLERRRQPEDSGAAESADGEAAAESADGEAAGGEEEHCRSGEWVALTERGLDLSNHVMAQFLF